MRWSFRIAAAATTVLGAVGCIPYTVGSTAQPVRSGESERLASYYFIPNGVSLDTNRASGHTLRGVDTEFRYGLDGQSDIGLRIPGGSGVVVTYKRRLGADTSSVRAAVAVEAGGGIVNLGDHAMVQLTLIGSGREDSPFVPYGGLHAVQVAPLSAGAVHDTPTIGAFAGLRMGDSRNAISPELGVYYDHSALGIRRGDLIVVPSVTVMGDRLMRLLPRLLR